MCMIMIYTYLPSVMVPQDIGSLTMSELYRLTARAKICREMLQQDIQIGIAKAFPQRE